MLGGRGFESRLRTMATISEIRNLINDTPAGGLCSLPGGVVDCPDFTPVVIPRSMTIRGNGTVFNLPPMGTPSDSFLKADALPSGSYLEVTDLTVNGPLTDGWPTDRDLSTASAISYQLYKTWDSKMVVRNVKTTGGYSYGVSRSGGGIFEVKNCDLQGWVGGIAFFEGHGGWGDLILRDTRLTAPTWSKYSSIGMYIHPHLHINAERVTGTGWNRFVIYLNGTPQSAGHHDLVEVTAINCPLIQSGSGSVTTLIRCKETGNSPNMGSFIKGDLLAVDCIWESDDGIGLLRDVAANRCFVRNRISTNSYWLAASAGVMGTLEAINCVFDLSKNGSRFKTTNLSTMVSNFVGCTYEGQNTSGFAVNIEGGVLNLTKTVLPQNSRALAPGVING